MLAATGLLVAAKSTVEQAEELSLRLKKKERKKREKAKKRDEVNPVLQRSQQIAKTLSLGKAAEEWFGNLPWVAQTL